MVTEDKLEQQCLIWFQEQKQVYIRVIMLQFNIA